MIVNLDVDAILKPQTTRKISKNLPKPKSTLYRNITQGRPGFTFSLPGWGQFKPLAPVSYAPDQHPGTASIETELHMRKLAPGLCRFGVWWVAARSCCVPRLLDCKPREMMKKFGQNLWKPLSTFTWTVPSVAVLASTPSASYHRPVCPNGALPWPAPSRISQVRNLVECLNASECRNKPVSCPQMTGGWTTALRARGTYISARCSFKSSPTVCRSHTTSGSSECKACLWWSKAEKKAFFAWNVWIFV